ncbi:MAG: glycosyl hydrolase, partial [Bacteroidales bacterium]|nr:glycosyl hydrolase [Bacteroidales bacterium]
AMQAEGREWVDMFSPELVAGFDYAFTDAMTWTNRNGTRMRLWMQEETEVGDPEDFMEQLVAQIEKVVTEPVAIYVNPTYLPDEIAERYEELWTDERIDRVVRALKENGVALELNDRYRLPGSRMIKKAKEAGVKFAMGTNNTGSEDLGMLEWALEMVDQHQLQPTDMFLPSTE